MKILIQAVQPKLQIDKVVQLAEVCCLHHHCERLTCSVKQDL